MQIGLAAYFRHLAARCEMLARASQDPRAARALLALSSELADKAEVLEVTFKVVKE